jgi:hypothetical protein
MPPQKKRSFLERLFGPEKRKPVQVAARPAPEPEPAVLEAKAEEPEFNTGYSERQEIQEKQREPAPVVKATPEVARQMDVLAMYASQQQALQNEQQRVIGYAQQGMSDFLFGQQRGPDPDPRNFLPHWKRYYGDLGKGFLNGGGK